MSDDSIEKKGKFQDQAESLRELLDDSPLPTQDQAATTDPLESSPLPDDEDMPDISMSIDELNRMIEELCLSKAEEYHLLGYEQVTAEEIWKCVSSKYKNSYPALHVIVNDILSLKPDKFMNWLLIQAYKS